MEFENDLPGYALDLTSNIYLVLNDLTRYSMSIKNPTKDLLEKQILMSMGIPFALNKRYEKYFTQTNILDYFIKMFLSGDIKIKEKCIAILDHLYLIIPNDEDHATEYLQIQKMDLRKSKLSVIDDKYIAIEPSISGAAEKLTKGQENTNKSDKIISDLINECNNRLHDGQLTLNHCVETIDQLIDKIKKSTHSFTYENSLIALISYVYFEYAVGNKYGEYCKRLFGYRYRLFYCIMRRIYFIRTENKRYKPLTQCFRS